MISGKRAVDVTVSAVGLIALSPILVAVSIAIVVEDGASPIFRQRRLGKGGQQFWVYKFRKLKNRPNDTTPLVVTPDDERYTRVGKFLDATKLNELPQLLNVLKGDMSLVGPRPELPNFSHCYAGSYRDLLRHAPGIFGPSQTEFRNEADMYPAGVDKCRFYESNLFKRKAELDLKYYSAATVASDLYWIFRSMKAVISDRRVHHQTIQAE